MGTGGVPWELWAVDEGWGLRMGNGWGAGRARTAQERQEEPERINRRPTQTNADKG
jgi:hypothetical protein